MIEKKIQVGVHDLLWKFLLRYEILCYKFDATEKAEMNSFMNLLLACNCLEDLFDWYNKIVTIVYFVLLDLDIYLVLFFSNFAQ